MRKASAPLIVAKTVVHALALTPAAILAWQIREESLTGSGGLGVLQAGAVEESNVELTSELVNMITAQRIYQANAQTIKTQDQILQTMVNLR